MNPLHELIIDGKAIGAGCPTYFIADIAANHDGDLERAKDLINLAKEAGADAAKFQHFKADTIVSERGFRDLGAPAEHQRMWTKSVFEVYRDASIDMDWTAALSETCVSAGIAFFTTPYAVDIVDAIDPYVAAYKIGSGDITWIEFIEYIAARRKPYILASGASTMDDVHRAVSSALKINPNFALLQCNTNYTGSLENFRFIQLNVLKSYRAMYPDLVLGLSDHTPGHATVLGAIALGASIVEKHFTDDVKRAGPDHSFSMDPAAWREMVDRARELELALGCGVKQIEENEKRSVIVQRRAICAARELPAGHVLARRDFELLRPCPLNAYPPYRIGELIGRRLTRPKGRGEHFGAEDL